MNNTKTTLLAALPLIFIIGALAAAILVLPKTNLDIRDKAAEPTPATVRQPAAKPGLTPSYQYETETACTSLYQPVCGTDNKTYPSECEANAAGVTVAYQTPCTTPLRQDEASPLRQDTPVIPPGLSAPVTP